MFPLVWQQTIFQPMSCSTSKELKPLQHRCSLMIYQKSFDTVYSLTTKKFICSLHDFGVVFEWNMQRADPESKGTEWTKVMRKRWSARHGYDVLRGMNIHILSGFLSIAKVFCPWKILRNIYWIFNCDFWFTPLDSYRTDNALAHRYYFMVHAVTLRSDCWVDSTFVIFSVMMVHNLHSNWYLNLSGIVVPYG